MHEPRLYDNPQLSVVCVSIGTPEKALLVCDNLGIDKDLLYVDPEADVHRKLGLEKSIQSTFLSPQTPLAMKKILVDDFAKYVSAPLRRKRAKAGETANSSLHAGRRRCDRSWRSGSGPRTSCSCCPRTRRRRTTREAPCSSTETGGCGGRTT